MDSQDREREQGYETGPDRPGPSTEFDAAKAREGARLLLEAVGRNPNETGLYDTWDRRVPAMLETLTAGRRPTEKPVMRTFPAETDGLIVKTGIPLYSMCEHHLLPFHGVAHVAYLPGEEMVGLSKLVRYVRWRARRLTTQEALTAGLATGLRDELDARGVLVEVTASHLCEAMRGVETATATTTREALGSITEADRESFRESIRRADGGGC